MTWMPCGSAVTTADMRFDLRRSDAFYAEQCARPPHATDVRAGAALLGLARLRELRRAGRPDRADASRAGRTAPLDFRTALPARAELLHGAARSGSATAGHLHRLAA